MPWTYSGDPATSNLDAVRFYVQDTREDFPYLTNEEIDYVLHVWMPLYGSALYCAAVCAEIIASKFAREVSVSADGVSVGANELQQKYKTLAEDLRDAHKAHADAGGGAEIPSEHWNDRFDSSIRPGVFSIGIHDNMYVGQQEYSNYVWRSCNPELT